MAEPPVSSKIEHLDIVIDATIRAGEKIVQIYESDFEEEKKNDTVSYTHLTLPTISSV